MPIFDQGEPMRRRLSCLAALLLIAGAYIASPFISLWTLREAIRRADTTAIESRVEWPTVRESLKSSLSRHPSLLPMLTAAGSDVTPSLWQRVKGAFGATMLDRFVESYVTPEGLPKLFDYRRLWRERVAGVAAEPADATAFDCLRRFWNRIKRAEFQSLTRVEFEMEDRNITERRYVSVMQLRGLGWRLTELRVVSADVANAIAGIEPKSSGPR